MFDKTSGYAQTCYSVISTSRKWFTLNLIVNHHRWKCSMMHANINKHIAFMFIYSAGSVIPRFILNLFMHFIKEKNHYFNFFTFSRRTNILNKQTILFERRLNVFFFSVFEIKHLCTQIISDFVPCFWFCFRNLLTMTFKMHCMWCDEIVNVKQSLRLL